MPVCFWSKNFSFFLGSMFNPKPLNSSETNSSMSMNQVCKLGSNLNDRKDPNSPAQEIAPTSAFVNET